MGYFLWDPLCGLERQLYSSIERVGTNLPGGGEGLPEVPGKGSGSQTGNQMIRMGSWMKLQRSGMSHEPDEPDACFYLGLCPLSVPHDSEQNDQMKSKPVPPFLPLDLDERSWNIQAGLLYTKGDGKGDTITTESCPWEVTALPEAFKTPNKGRVPTEVVTVNFSKEGGTSSQGQELRILEESTALFSSSTKSYYSSFTIGPH